MAGARRRGTVRVVRGPSRRALLLVPAALVLAGCGSLDRRGLERKLEADTNRYVGTQAVQSVRCTPSHAVARASFACSVVPSNGRPAIRVLVAVEGAGYTILRTTTTTAR